jgi:hypothetical protein
MISSENYGNVREVVALFDSAENLQDAIDDLLTSGFDLADLSMLADLKEVERKLGRRLSGVAELDDNAAAPRAVYVSTDSIGVAQGALIGVAAYVGALAAAGGAIAYGGGMALAIACAALGGGCCALAGAFLAGRVGARHARYLSEQLARGGLLLWVRAWEGQRERHAEDIMRRHAGRNVHAHLVGGAA